MKKLFGTVIPIVTPLTEDDKIDIPSLQRLIDHCIEMGANCLYPCGTTGEMMYISVEERKIIAEETVRYTSKRVPVFVQVGAWNLSDTIALAKHAVDIGADGIGVVTPVFYNISDRGLVDYYQAVASSVPDDFPVYLYAIPQNAVNDLSPAVAQQIANICPNVVGIKYSYPDMTKLQKFMLINNETFSVLVGPDHLFHAVCAVGGDGVVSGNAMIVGEHYAMLWQAIQNKDMALAAKIQRRTNRLNELLCSVNNIAAYKTVLKAEGILATARVRRPMYNLTDDQERSLLEQLKAMNYKQVLVD